MLCVVLAAFVGLPQLLKVPHEASKLLLLRTESRKFVIQLLKKVLPPRYMLQWELRVCKNRSGESFYEEKKFKNL